MTPIVKLLVAIALSVAVVGTVASADEPGPRDRVPVRIVESIDLDDPRHVEARRLFDADPGRIEPTTIRRRAVAVDRGALLDAARRVADGGDATVERFEIELFPGVTVRARPERMQSFSFGEGGFAFVGRIERLRHSLFAISVHGEAVVASFSAPQLGGYRLHTRIDDRDDAVDSAIVTIVTEVDPGQFDECGCCVDPRAGRLPVPPELLDALAPFDPFRVLDGPFHEDDPQQAADGGIAGDEGGLASNENGDWIDLLVVYTTGARIQAGGTNAIRGLIQLCVVETNQIWNDSAINPTLHLVGWAETNYDESPYTGNTVLSHLREVNDGFMDEVHPLRNQTGADLVKLLTISGLVSNTGGGLCGMAYTNASASWAFSFTAVPCAAGPGWTFAHELGHNFGANHDHAEDLQNGPSYDWGFGHGFVGDSGSTHRTVMVRQSQPGVRIPRFSNPNLTFDGQPTGVALNQPQPAHVAKVHNDRAVEVSNFRKRVAPIQVWVDLVNCSPGNQQGTFGAPYCTIQQGVTNVLFNGTISVKPGSGSTGSITITKPMTLNAPNGAATISP